MELSTREFSIVVESKSIENMYCTITCTKKPLSSIVVPPQAIPHWKLDIRDIQKKMKEKSKQIKRNVFCESSVHSIVHFNFQRMPFPVLPFFRLH